MPALRARSDRRVDGSLLHGRLLVVTIGVRRRSSSSPGGSASSVVAEDGVDFALAGILGPEEEVALVAAVALLLAAIERAALVLGLAPDRELHRRQRWAAVAVPLYR